MTSSIDDPLLLHGRKFQQPELVHISIRRLADEDEVIDDVDLENILENFFINYFNCQMSSTDPEGRQIPVISDIERIKKVVEIIEFVGEKVGELIDKIDVPTSDYNEDERKATENPQGIETP